ncbi:hypothetical protein PAXRUDRAFT_17661 [Paxillus rubicundulus Ve08.2h10]|uniref:Unplaced genomic scaffold scaffold_2269, whole genome shotgun sequence n=1 Tax=Paxillus rubicundulus Ve08.2h10 TaxID=930991 RepID=A0A0D0DGV5_9AGAM|nr:hypothetical protein PAXRUDRAFT_17661 [Paxillus rubicundulus Ve08.2h10]
MAQALPQGRRACQTGHVDATWPTPSFRPSGTTRPNHIPKAHEHTGWPPTNPPAPPLAHERATRHPSTPDGPSPPSSPTNTQRRTSTRDGALTVLKAHEDSRSLPNDTPTPPQPYGRTKWGTLTPDGRPALPKAHEHALQTSHVNPRQATSTPAVQNATPPSLRATSTPSGAPTTHTAPNTSLPPPRLSSTTKA